MSGQRIRPLSEIIVGQPHAISVLQRALESGQLFPSLVFHGPPGVGKLSTALLLARALLCGSEEDVPCGDCRSCRRITDHALVHPDVRYIFPETRTDFGKVAPEDARAIGIDPQEEQTEAAANPVWSILIDRVRQGIGFLQRRPSEGRFSILILDQAHRLEAAAANSLLKTLEEPPSHAVLILLTPSWHALIPTIRSRCQPLPFQLVARSSLVSYLVEHREMGAEESVLRAGLSGGRLGAALGLDLDDFRRRRDALLGHLGDLARRGDPGVAVARAEALVQGGEALDENLEILMTLLRDLLILGAAPAQEALLVNVDIADTLRELKDTLRDRVVSAVEHLETTMESIRHKGNRQLLIENFLMGLVPVPPVAPAPGSQRSLPARG